MSKNIFVALDFNSLDEALDAANKLKNQIALGLLISGASLIAFPFFKSEFLVYSLIVVFAAGGAMVTPNLLSAVSLLSRTNTGRNISIQSSTNSVGQILGPVLGTWLVTGGFYYPFIIQEKSFIFFYKLINKKINYINGILSIWNHNLYHIFGCKYVKRLYRRKLSS